MEKLNGPRHWKRSHLPILSARNRPDLGQPSNAISDLRSYFFKRRHRREAEPPGCCGRKKASVNLFRHFLSLVPHLLRRFCFKINGKLFQNCMLPKFNLTALALHIPKSLMHTWI
jgi:hypothetical protein